MITSGRYLYYLQDIAELEENPRLLNSAEILILQRTKIQMAEFVDVHPEEAKRIQELPPPSSRPS
jgi:hypothetical protein